MFLASRQTEDEYCYHYSPYSARYAIHEKLVRTKGANQAATVQDRRAEPFGITIVSIELPACSHNLSCRSRATAVWDVMT
jgi:hypothetical protein